MRKKETIFGKLSDGTFIYEYFLRSPRAEVGILSLGATLHSFSVDGIDIVAGFDTVEDYENDDSYQGAVVGRTCNRIRGGTLIVGNKVFPVTQNERAGSLHGGASGFNRKVWTMREHTRDSVTLCLFSRAGEEGYPGNLNVTVTYTLEDTRLKVVFEAVSDEPTVVSMTQHAYFHLGGYGTSDILSHTLRVDADTRTEVDRDLEPTGAHIPVDGTVYDFRNPHRIGMGWSPDFKGFDDNFILSARTRALVMGEMLHYAATLSLGNKSLEVWTDRPCLQVYIGGALKGLPLMKGNRLKQPFHTCCLETQTEPDLAHRRGETLLSPDGEYRAVTVFAVSISG